MTRDQLLKELATIMERWPTDSKDALGILDGTGFYWRADYVVNPKYDFRFSDKQWKEERYRLGLDKRPEEEFSWDEAPDWANWGAVDYSGHMYWYGNKPNLEYYHWAAAAPATLFKRGSALCDNWKETLTPRPTQRITLQPGDYIETKGVSEADYKKVYDAFQNSGIYEDGEDFALDEYDEFDFFGIATDRRFTCYHSSRKCLGRRFSRLLTVDQVINATNAKPQPGEWIEWSGGECPVSPETLVECRTEVDPEGADTRPACEWDWNTEINPITHYRVVENESTDADKDDTEMMDISYQERDGGVAIITTPSSAESLDTLHAEVLELQKEMAHIEAIMTEKKSRIMEILGDVFED